MKEQLERQLTNVKKLKLFITFEGGEGTGKSTTALALETKLLENGYEVQTTREPGGNNLPVAESIRKIIMEHGDINPITELLLFNASRSEHVEKLIKPKLDEGAIVISDRFSDSTVVYQGVVKNVSKEMIVAANEIACQGLEPNLVFIFDLDPKLGLNRINNGDRENNRFDGEEIDFHSKIRDAYKELANTNKNKYILVDASKSTEEIVSTIFEYILKYETEIN